MKPYAHQKREIETAPERWGLFWGTGTGKTFASLWLAARNPTKTLIVTKKALVKSPWERDASQFLDDFIVISKENLKKRWDSLPECQTVICDECHFFAQATSGLFKSLNAYLTKWNVRYRYLLTATPYCSTPWNIYNIAVLLGRTWNYTAFRSSFFDRHEIHWRRCPKGRCAGCQMCVRTVYEPKKDAKMMLAAVLRKLGSVVKMEDCVDVPEQVFVRESLDLTAEQKRLVKGVVEGNPAVSAMMKHRIEVGHISGDGYEPDRFIGCAVTDRVLELADEFPKVVVVCRYRTQMNDLTARLLPRNVMQLHGDTKDAAATVKAAEEASDCVLIVQAACSEGYELPSFPVMVFASMDWSYVNYRQIIGRILRINKLKKNLYIHLVPKGISEKIYESVIDHRDYDPAKT